MRRYLCTIEEVEENEQRSKRRRIDPALNVVDVAGRSGLQQQWINQRQQHAAVEPRTIQNTRRGKNMRLDDSSTPGAKYLEKQIRRSNHILAQIGGDNEETEDNSEESEYSEEDTEVSHFDVKDNEEKFFYSEINNKRVESEDSISLDGCGKPNSEMLEIMARRQQKLTQKKGQGQRMPRQSKFDNPELSSVAATIVGRMSTQNHSKPMEVDFVPRGRRSIRAGRSKFVKPETSSLWTDVSTTVGQVSTQNYSEPMEIDIEPKGRRGIREKLDSSVSQDSGKLTPAMQEILVRKQQASKSGPTKKLDQTVSSTAELVSSISVANQPVEKGTGLGRRSIRNSGTGNVTTSIREMSLQTENVALKKERNKSLQQPDATIPVTEKGLKTHNVSINKDKCVTEDSGKLTPAMQEILARKQQKNASKQGQNKKPEQMVSSSTENFAVVKVEQLSPKVTLEYSKSLEMETKTTTTYITSTTKNTDKPTSAMQAVLVKKQQQQQIASKPRKSTKLNQTVTSTVETSPVKLIPIHLEAETKTRRKSTRQPQPNASGAGDSLYHKPQEENKELQKEKKQDQLDPVVSENSSKLTPAMKAVLAQKQQKEAASKQGVNKKLTQTVTSTVESVLNASTDQSSIQKRPAENETKSGGRNARKTRAEKSILDVDVLTEEKQQMLNEPVKKGRGKKANQTVSNAVQHSASSLSEPEDERPKPRGKRIRANQTVSNAVQPGASTLSEPEDERPKPKGKRIRKEVPDVSSTTKAEESLVHVESKTVSARGKRSTTAALLKECNENTEINLKNVPQVKKGQQIEKETAKRGKESIGRSEDLKTTQNVENPTPAMQQLLEKKQQRALEKSAKGKK